MGADAHRCCYATKRAALPWWSQWSQVECHPLAQLPIHLADIMHDAGKLEGCRPWRRIDSFVHPGRPHQWSCRFDLTTLGSVVIPQKTDALSLQAAPVPEQPAAWQLGWVYA